jgi:hypothetical protein
MEEKKDLYRRQKAISVITQVQRGKGTEAQSFFAKFVDLYTFFFTLDLCTFASLRLSE